MKKSGIIYPQDGYLYFGSTLIFEEESEGNLVQKGLIIQEEIEIESLDSGRHTANQNDFNSKVYYKTPRPTFHIDVKSQENEVQKGPSSSWFTDFEKRYNKISQAEEKTASNVEFAKETKTRSDKYFEISRKSGSVETRNKSISKTNINGNIDRNVSFNNKSLSYQHPSDFSKTYGAKYVEKKESVEVKDKDINKSDSVKSPDISEQQFQENKQERNDIFSYFINWFESIDVVARWAIAAIAGVIAFALIFSQVIFKAPI